MDPEMVHEQALKLIESGLIHGDQTTDIRLPVRAMGLTFPNPLGLAAGFDKNGKAVLMWERFGFGFAEIGTVTRYAQPGNPKPRLFRLPEDQALINRLGFNNEGADAVAERLSLAYSKKRPSIPIGINLGKSKATPLEHASEDYAYSFRRLKDLGDYFVVNVSSPNTPGLRSLQSKDQLSPIFQAMAEIDSEKPRLVKVAPELGEAELDEILEIAQEFQLAGVIATNTTLSREGLQNYNRQEKGGLSGAPVFQKANRALDYLAKRAPSTLTLVGVGGIMTGGDIATKLKLGAKLAQTYTGFVYGGPTFPADALREMLSDYSPQIAL